MNKPYMAHSRAMYGNSIKMATPQDIENPYNSYLVVFFHNLLLNEQTPLHNRDLHILVVNTQSAIQSAIQSANAAHSKSNNCTLEETAVLQTIRANPRATQKQIAELILVFFELQSTPESLSRERQLLLEGKAYN